MTSDQSSDKLRVLFLCTGNSARSQMAEAWLRHLGSDHFDAHSAGLEPKGIHPLTKIVLEEAGLDMQGQYSKGLSVYLGKTSFAYLVTVCGNAEARCPYFPGVGSRQHWPFNDPAACRGTDAEQLAEFRRVRDQIAERIRCWLKELAES
jgi:arsenate reductase